jgi:GT2 family glycosyltransferase
VTPSVAIVVLNWNNAPDTTECIASINRVEYDNYTVLVVDNGSTDDSASFLRHTFPAIELLELGNNLGYAEGNNVGIRHVLRSGPDYVCVLNNDTEIAPDFLQRMVEVSERDAQIGMVGPKMYFFEPPNMVFSAGSTVDWRRGTLVHRGIWQHEKEAHIYTAEEDVDFIIGCGMLVRSKVIERVGLFDPRYYLNFEDVDWAIRIRKGGYKVRYTPRAHLWHKVSASLGRGSPQNTYYMTRNSLLFFKSHTRGHPKWRTLSRLAVRNLGHILAWSVKHENQEAKRKRLYAYMFGLLDATLDRYGEMSETVKRKVMTESP